MSAVHASRELWFPISGPAAIVSIKNASDRSATVSVAAFAAGKPQAVTTLHIPAQATVKQSVQGQTGSLRLTSERPVSATLHVSGATLEGIPARFTVPAGSTTSVHGPKANARYRLHAAETHGFPIYFAIRIKDASGRTTSARREYLGPFETLSWDFAESGAWIEIEGINGSGRIVATGAQTDPDGAHLTFHRMTLRRPIRHTVPRPELLAYMLAVAAIIAGGVVARRR